MKYGAYNKFKCACFIHADHELIETLSQKLTKAGIQSSNSLLLLKCCSYMVNVAIHSFALNIFYVKCNNGSVLAYVSHSPYLSLAKSMYSGPFSSYKR